MKILTMLLILVLVISLTTQILCLLKERLEFNRYVERQADGLIDHWCSKISERVNDHDYLATYNKCLADYQKYESSKEFKP